MMHASCSSLACVSVDEQMIVVEPDNITHIVNTGMIEAPVLKVGVGLRRLLLNRMDEGGSTGFYGIKKRTSM
jgi:hypothetical protein